MRLNVRSWILPLIIANVAVFALQMMLGNLFTESLMLISSDVTARPWILFTSMFLHGGLDHILFNMYGLFIFGSLLERKIGPNRFIALYLGSGLAAALLSSLFYARALGASGALMGVIGAMVILMPNLQLLFFFIIPMPLWVAGIVWAVLDSIGIFVPSGIANVAHLVGMGCGLLFGLWLKKKHGKIQRIISSKSQLTEEDMLEYLKSGRI